MAIVVPCKDCADRHLGCHSECKKYLAYKESWEIIRKQRIKDYEFESSLNEIHKKRRIRR